MAAMRSSGEVIASPPYTFFAPSSASDSQFSHFFAQVQARTGKLTNFLSDPEREQIQLWHAYACHQV
jgi:hypothetical protein